MADSDIEQARAELVKDGGNAFAVAGHSDGRTLILAMPQRTLTRAEVVNLVAWLTIVARLTDGDILPILRGQGYVLRESGYSGPPFRDNMSVDDPDVE